MAKHILLTITLIISFLTNFAQTTTLFQTTNDNSITITDKSPYSAEVLNILAQANGPKNLEFTIKEHIEVIKHGTQLMAKASIANVVKKGDYRYQQFNINSFLTPSLVSFTYQFSNSKGEILKTETFVDEAFKSGAPLVKFNYDSFEGDENCELILTDVAFNFTKNDLKDLDNFTYTVNQYYDVDAQLKLMNKELDQLFLDSIELLQNNLNITLENNEALSAIKSYRLISKLQLDGNDPLNYRSNVSKTEVKNREIKKNIEQKIKYMHKTYFEKGMQNLTWNDITKAIDLFNLSLNEKQNYPPPYYQLANINYINKNYKQAIDSCMMVIKKMSPDTDTRYDIIKLSEKIIYHYIDSIHLLIEEKAFAEAVSKLNSTIYYSENIEGVKVFSEFEAIYSKLYYAYYNVLVNETEILLGEENLLDAHFNIDSLSRFRDAHIQYITSAEKEYELQNKLYNAWIKKGIFEQENKRPNNALMAFEKARNICKIYDKVLCTEELAILLQASRQVYYNNLLEDVRKVISEAYADSALLMLDDAKNTLFDWKLEPNPLADTLFIAANQVKYDQLVEQGDLAMLNYDQRQSLAFYNEAIDLSKEVGILPHPLMPDKLGEASKACSIMYCGHGQTQVDALQINKAYHYLNKATEIAEQYNIRGDKEVDEAIKALEELLGQGECSKAMYEFNIQLNVANKFIETFDFIKAEGALNKSIKLNKLYKNCELPDSISINLLKEISPLKTYQETREKIDRLVEEKSYNNAIEQYIYISSFYDDSIINNFGIKHPDLYDFIITHRDNGIKDFAIRHYAEQQETDKSLNILYSLYQNQYNANWAKKSQIALGVQLAMDDFEKNPNQDIEAKIIAYTKNDKWFAQLKKAYLTQWKKL